eukprot:6210100-Pleurochrysis_carterae.AAC.1
MAPASCREPEAGSLQRPHHGFFCACALPTRASTHRPPPPPPSEVACVCSRRRRASQARRARGCRHLTRRDETFRAALSAS